MVGALVGLDVGSQLWAFPDVVWNHRGIAFLHKPASPQPRGGWRENIGEEAQAEAGEGGHEATEMRRG